MRENRSARLLARDIAFFANGHDFAQSHVANTVVVGEEIGDRIVPVIEDKELAIGIRLTEKTSDRAGHEATPAAGRHDARDERKQGAHGHRISWYLTHEQAFEDKSSL